MKKWTAMLLALLMCLSLCACGGGDKQVDNQENDSSSGEAVSSTEDLVAVESIELTPINNVEQTEIKVKIRNLTDEKKDYISVDIQALDENGDVITVSKSVNVQDLQAGQAGNAEGYRLNCPYEDIRALRIYGYSFGVERDTPDTFTIVEEIDFAEPLTFTMSEIKSNEGKDVYLWVITP